MQNGSYYIPRERLHSFLNPAAMNNEEGLYLAWETDPVAAGRVLPPQFELADASHPVVMAYVVNIREPTFAPWYMEAGLYLPCRYGERSGVYFLNLQLSGPGAGMGLTSGREGSGLPKKLCERILVARTGDCAHALVERKGRRIFDLEVQLGAYNTPEAAAFFAGAEPGGQGAGSCFLFKYEESRAADGHVVLPAVNLIDYDSVTDYTSWDPGAITALTMEPSLDDPWAELSVVRPLGAGWSVNSNWVRSVSSLGRIEGDEADELFSYLFSGRWDRSTITPAQVYGQL